MKTIPREVVEKKFIGQSLKLKALRDQLKLSEFQKNFLVGTVLGDACLIGNQGSNKHRLQIEQCLKQKDYVWWKYSILKDWIISAPKFQATTKSWRFRTISHLDFSKFYNLFYQNGKKIVPAEIESLLKSPISLAVWFMDDGALGSRKKGFTLNSQGFTFLESQRLRECLYKNFSLRTAIHKDKKSWRIFIPPSDTKKFKEIVKEFILPGFQYKLSSIDPVET